MSPAQECPSQSSVTQKDSALDYFNFQEVLFQGFPSAGDGFGVWILLSFRVTNCYEGQDSPSSWL